jgi:hypothetical protein
MAYGLSVMYAKDDKRMPTETAKVDPRLPNFSYKRGPNGRIIRVSNQPNKKVAQ